MLSTLNMARLDFSFDSRFFAFGFRAGSRSCACGSQLMASRQGTSVALRVQGDGDIVSRGTGDDYVIDPALLAISGLVASDGLFGTASGVEEKRSLEAGLSSAALELQDGDSCADPVPTPSSSSERTTGDDASSNVSYEVIPTPAHGNLGKLPVEIRLLIFKILLVSPVVICDAHKLVGNKEVMEINCPRVKGLEPAILRTCRAINNEALPVLYGYNRFYFDSPTALTDFAHHERTRLFGPENTPYGRLTRVQHIILRLKSEFEFQRADRNALWLSWKFVLEPTPASMVEFPSLLDLTLDFSDWQLGQTEEYEVNVSSSITCK